METDARLAVIARQFLEVVPPLLGRLSQELREAGEHEGPLTMAQFRSMAQLSQRPRSLSQLAESHRVSPPTMSRLISTLVERGWVARETDPQDRRQVVLRLTEAGVEMWEWMRVRMAAHMVAVLQLLDDGEVAGLEVALVGLSRVATAHQGNKECER